MKKEKLEAENEQNKENEAKTYIGKCMLFGVAIGATIGAVIGFFTEILYMPIFAPVGMIVGLVIGSRIKKNKK